MVLHVIAFGGAILRWCSEDGRHAAEIVSYLAQLFTTAASVKQEIL